MKLKKYQSYIYSSFIKKFFITSFIFFCIVVIINILEEIKFTEKYNTDTYYTFYLPRGISKYRVGSVPVTGWVSGVYHLLNHDG